MHFLDGRPHDYTYLKVNQAFEALTGLKDVVGKRVSEVIPKLRESDPQWFETFGRVTLSGQPEQFEIRLNALDKWFSVSVYSPEKEHFVAVFDEITERKRAENAARESVSLLEATLESTVDGILVADGHGRMVRFNRKFAEMWRLPRHLIAAGNDDAALRFVLAQLEEPEHFLGKVRELYAEPEAVSSDVLTFKDGRVFERYSQPQRIGARVVGRVWSFRDVTERRQAERVAQESQTRFAAMADASPALIWSSGPDKLCNYFNQTWLDFTGRTREQELGNGWTEGVHPDDLARCLATYSENFEARQPFRMEYRLRRYDGKYRWILDSAVPRFHADGSFAGYIGSCIDLTGHKEAQAALRQSARASELLRNSMVALNACPDLDSALACLVQQAIDLAGLDCGSAYLIEGQEAVLRYQVGLDPEFVKLVLRRPLNTEYIAAVLENPREVYDVTARFPERRQFVEAYGLRHFYCIGLVADQRPFGFLNVVSRRSDPPNVAGIELIRVLATETEALFVRLGAEQRLRSILQSMADGVALQAADGTIIDCNRSAEKILGLSREQIMGRQSTDPRWKATREDGRPFPGEEHPGMVALRTGQSCHDVTMGLCLPDGSQRWISINAEPMFKPGEARPYAVVNSFADVTERRRFEERLRQSQKMEGIGHLAGGMAHEFNNILAAMMMNLGLAQTLNTGAEVGVLLRETDDSCRRAAGLINQLLAFSRQSMMQREPMDLAAAVSTQCKLLHRLLGERIILEFASPAGLPWVKADKGMIEQVVLNLCLNARDAMKEGGRLQLHVEEAAVGAEQARAQEGAQPGNYLCLSVADTGCGMDEQTRQRLFEPFFTTKDVGKGPGLGLATVRGIVQQHDGWVEVESLIGKGSTFRIYLPAVAQPQANPAAAPTAAPAGSQGTILVVEDEPMLRTASRKLLASVGYAVLEAADGRQALALWREHRADIKLVYTDMVMPGDLNGLQLAQLLLADAPGLKVIITSGYHTDQPNLNQVADSSIIYLPKPCSPGDLTAVIRKCLSGGGAGEEIPEFQADGSPGVRRSWL